MNTNITGGLSGKRDEIQIICNQFFCDILCITETWCTDEVPNNAISLGNDFVSYRRDRKDGRTHGGIICYIKHTIPVIKEWKELDSKNLETLFITTRPKMMPRCFTHITVGVVYHPPSNNNPAGDWTMSKHLCDCVDHILKIYPHSGIIICGDFNHMRDSYLKSSYQLKQLVVKPTHLKSKIDLYYTNMAQYYIDKPQHEPGIGLSKHQVVICKPNITGLKRSQSVYITKRSQGHKERTALSRVIRAVNWDPLFMLPTCKEQFLVFDSVMTNLVEEFLPLKTVKRNSDDWPWVTDEFLSLIRQRQYHFHAGNKEEFHYYRNKVDKTRKKLKPHFYKRKMSGLRKVNPKNWWRNVKEITGMKAESNNLQGMANVVCDGDMCILAEQINQAFFQVSSDMTPLTTEDNFTISQVSHAIVPDKYILSVAQVEKKLSHTNVSKAIGPDGIPNWLLKGCSQELAPPICAIWNSSLRDSYQPPLWKSADVCPLPKVNAPKRVDKDLRPISLTPVLSKGLEAYVRDFTMDIISDLLDPYQFGSIAGSSTVHALIELHHNWLIGLEKPGKVVRILFLDFRKAFDRVDHTILLNKLANMGVPDFLIKWMTSFLTDRKQRVKIGDTTSEWVHVKAGVPQGTLTGPPGFLVHINDLKTVCKMVKYVDDSTIWEVCDRTGEDSMLPVAANQAEKWTDKNLMQINTDKTKELVIYFGKKKLTLKPIMMGGSTIEQVSTSKTLGVIFNDKLTWDDHIDEVCSKASRRLYFLRLLYRAGTCPADITQVYTSIVRSVLEYACELWHPGITVAHSHSLEHIQERALAIAYPDLEYQVALKTTGLENLASRRKNQCVKLFRAMENPKHKLHYLLPPKRNINVNLRSLRPREPFKCRTERAKKSLVNYCMLKHQDY